MPSHEKRDLMFEEFVIFQVCMHDAQSSSGARYLPFHPTLSPPTCNVLFLSSENAILGIIYSLLRSRQNIFLSLFSTKFVIKCATKILKIS